MSHRVPAAAFALALTMVVPAFAAAPTVPIPVLDLAAQRGYVLTLDKVKRWNEANDAFEAAKAKNPALKAEDRKASDEGGDTLAQMRAQVMRHPNIYSFFQKAGLSVDDAILIPVVVLGASAAESNPAAYPMVSPAQIAFYKQNKAALGGE